MRLLDGLLAGDDQFAILDGLFDGVVFVAVQVLDALNRLGKLLSLLQLRPSELLTQKLGFLRTLERVALDDPAHPLGGQLVGIIFHLNENETAVTAVPLVGFQYGMGGGA